MTKDKVYEALTALYLRLNGYFTTGLVIHSAERGQNAGEIDCLAVRFPSHHQSLRSIKESDFLDVSDKMIDLIICEVKIFRSQV
ncbi:MAG: hypothetical protein JKY31_00330 [Rhodobacteraceae bacterium]|nr:hypothetical protein [Paracoccaceae bacterium]